MLAIAETGTGVSEGIDIFELFITTKPQGTGLGLAIEREIVLHMAASFRTRAHREQVRAPQFLCRSASAEQWWKRLERMNPREKYSASARR